MEPDDETLKIIHAIVELTMYDNTAARRKTVVIALEDIIDRRIIMREQEFFDLNNERRHEQE